MKILSLVILIWCIFLHGAMLDGQTAQTIDVRSFGFPTEPLHRGGIGDYVLQRNSIQVTDTGKIYVGFLTQHHSSDVLSTRKNPQQWYEVDAFDDGQLTGSVQIPGFFVGARIVLLHTGQLLIYSGTQVVLADSDLHQIAHESVTPGNGRLNVSGSRDRAIIDATNGKQELTLPSLIFKASCLTGHAESFFDGTEIYLGEEVGNDAALRRRKIFARSNCGPPQLAFEYRGDPSWPTLLTGSRFVLTGSHLMQIIESGKQLYSENTDKAQFDRVIAVSPESRRFAVSISAWKGGSNFFDRSGRNVPEAVLVYDFAGHKLHQVKLSKKPEIAFDFALSPDGSHLAILNDGMVCIVNLQ